MKLEARALLTITAVFEFGMGLTTAAAPSQLVPILLGVPLEGSAAAVMARLAGAALMSLGVACWAGRREPRGPVARGIVAALLLYNAAVAALMVLARFGLGLPGPGILPIAALHAVMAGWCVASLAAAGSRGEE